MLEAQRSGQGQVVDAAMIDGAASLMTAAFGLHAAGITGNQRGSNILDGGAHFYEVYETSDGKYISLAPIEPKFYAEMLKLAGIAPDVLPQSYKREDWPQLKQRLAEVIKTRTRDQWCEILEGSDSCFAPVLDMDEVSRHPHHQARATFVDSNGVIQPNAAPRFSRTPAQIKGPPPEPGEHSEAALADWGFSTEEIGRLREAGIIAVHT
jgi:alpha-methylacyl-CoA racemase